MKLQHIKSRKACDFIMRKGNNWKGTTMMIRWLPGTPRVANRVQKDGMYLGTFASAKLHKSAVKRNRMRRRVREAFRIATKNRENVPTVQLLVTPRIASLDSPFELVLADVQTFLSALPPWQKPPQKNPASSTTR